MPSDGSDIRDAPDRIEIGSGATRRSITRADALYALHDLEKGAALDDAVLTLDDGAIAVFRETPGEGAPARRGKAGPVYRLQPGGSLGVPTGRIFIRFAGTVNAESKRAQLRGAGYDIAKVLAYAPNAAWLESRGGAIGDALRGIDALRAIDGVEHVEAELKQERGLRE